jgi:LmbE family N-acetylglucosaminyl deacetylase
MGRHIIYLSPHLDDVALSCGGLISRQVLEEAEVLVVTVFAGRPPEGGVSEFAAGLQDRWGDTIHPVDRRTDEDRRALRLLRANSLRLGYPDAIYRYSGESFLYTSREDLFGALHPLDRSLASQIAQDIAAISSPRWAVVYSPLAVGNHVDHQLVRNAMFERETPSDELVFYEDYPYVEQPGALTKVLEPLGPKRWTSEVQQFDESCLKRKIRAISAYRSQISALFETEQAMALRVREYSRAVGPEPGFGERYWRISAEDDRSPI